MQVGKVLSNGERHDGRAPDYDDWELNGDILVYYPVLDIALELSSMGIRVDEEALEIQLKEAGCEELKRRAYNCFKTGRLFPYSASRTEMKDRGRQREYFVFSDTQKRSSLYI